MKKYNYNTIRNIICGLVIVLSITLCLITLALVQEGVGINAKVVYCLGVAIISWAIGMLKV